MLKFSQYLEGKEYKTTKKNTVVNIVNKIIYHLKSFIPNQNIKYFGFFNGIKVAPLNVNEKTIDLNIQDPNLPKIIAIHLHVANEFKLKDAYYEDNKIVIEYNIPPLNFNILSNLQDRLFSTLIHELKHYNQISSDEDLNEPSYDYVMHQDEVEAYVNELYHFTRFRKNKSLRQNIIELANRFKSKLSLTDEQRDSVIEKYVQYANKMRYNLDKQYR